MVTLETARTWVADANRALLQDPCFTIAFQQIWGHSVEMQQLRTQGNHPFVDCREVFGDVAVEWSEGTFSAMLDYMLDVNEANTCEEKENMAPFPVGLLQRICNDLMIRLDLDSQDGTCMFVPRDKSGRPIENDVAPGRCSIDGRDGGFDRFVNFQLRHLAAAKRS
jgi:hypothetical protein